MKFDQTSGRLDIQISTYLNPEEENPVKKPPVAFETAHPNPSCHDVRDIKAEELAEKINFVHIVDVRQPDEYSGELGHIAGARLLVLDGLADRIDELPKDEPIVFVCRSGGRSGRATAHALENGFQYVFNLEGGMLRWNELGLPVER